MYSWLRLQSYKIVTSFSLAVDIAVAAAVSAWRIPLVVPNAHGI